MTKTSYKIVAFLIAIAFLCLSIFLVVENKERIINRVGNGIDISINKEGVNINTYNRYKDLELELKESQLKLTECAQELIVLNEQLSMLDANDEANAEEIVKLNNEIANINENISSLNATLEEIKTELIQLNEVLYKEKVRLFGSLKNNCSFTGQTWQTLGACEIDLANACDIFAFCSVVAYVDWGTLYLAVFIDGINVRQVGSNCSLSNTVVTSVVIPVSSGHHVIEFKIHTDNNTNTVTLSNYCENSYTIIEL